MFRILSKTVITRFKFFHNIQNSQVARANCLWYSPAYRQPKKVATSSIPQGMMTATCSPLILAFVLFSLSTMYAAILSALLCSVTQLMERVVWPCGGEEEEEEDDANGDHVSW